MSVEFTNYMTDKNGYSPQWNLVGTLWRHFKDPTQVYQIKDFSWDATRDEWNVIYRHNGVTCNRTISNFFKDQVDGKLRFTLV